MNLFKGKKRIGKFLDVPPQEATEKPARQMADTVQEQVPDELGELYEPDTPREEAPSAPPPSETEREEETTPEEKEVKEGKRMRSVHELVQDPGLWGGLNRPWIPVDEADVVVCGIPFDGGASFRKGAGEGPRAIREITFSICPTTEDFEVMDLNVLDQGDFDELDAQDRDALFAQIEDRAEQLVHAGKFFTFIGGDHSVSIPILRGVDRALGHDFGIIHIDAHFDLCDELGGDPLSHGCTERRALELAGVTDLDSIYFVGIRSAETCEAEFLNGRDANVISAAKVRKLGTKEVLKRIKKTMRGYDAVYVTIDIDALDPAYAPGTGTPQFGGLDPRELLGLLRGIMTDLPVIGFDLVEVAPPLDPSDITLFAARKILTECWGHYWRKTKKS